LKENKIILLSCGPFEKEFLGKIAHATATEFKGHVIIEECYLDLAPFYNPGRRQYDGNKLLHSLPECTGREYDKLIGLFKVDLFIPILTFIFGQAMLNHQTAIASVYRLRNELYGLKQDEELLLARTIKEVIHELGHTFGLIHCNISTCVMRSSTYVEDIDQKSSSLCGRCRSIIEEVLK
jgi:archaemetzincin